MVRGFIARRAALRDRRRGTGARHVRVARAVSRPRGAATSRTRTHPTSCSITPRMRCSSSRMSWPSITSAVLARLGLGTPRRGGLHTPARRGRRIRRPWHHIPISRKGVRRLSADDPGDAGAWGGRPPWSRDDDTAAGAAAGPATGICCCSTAARWRGCTHLAGQRVHAARPGFPRPPAAPGPGLLARPRVRSTHPPRLQRRPYRGIRKRGHGRTRCRRSSRRSSRRTRRSGLWLIVGAWGIQCSRHGLGLRGRLAFSGSGTWRVWPC